MKNVIASFFICMLLSAQPISKAESFPVSPKPGSNLIIITLDGFRWQELFMGADAKLIHDEKFTPDPATIQSLYWSKDEKERRQKLMPFFWTVLAEKGQVYGNRNHGNKVNTANIYTFSYPGYNEIFTGNTNWDVSSNDKKINKHKNVLEYLESKEQFKGKVVAFTSWDVFPYILNEKRSGVMVNSGYEIINDSVSSAQLDMINKVQTEAINNRGACRYDQLTFLAAKEYMELNKPRVTYIAFSGTDDYAHQRRYDLYLEYANKVDRMIAELWHWVQTTPGYKDNTTLLVTTDHGRGSVKWASHSTFIKGSSQTWLALMGPGIQPLGEIMEKQQWYQEQVAGLIAKVVGENFQNGKDSWSTASIH